MKMLTTPDSQTKNGASTSTSRKPSVSSTNLHADHVLLLDSLTASLKDELKRGLSIVDSIVNQLAQAKWVFLNVDKTLEELYENCPACDINANKKSTAGGGSLPAGGNKSKLKVLPMVSGHTFQRPNITVTRVEEEQRESTARARANVSLAPASNPIPEPSSSTSAAHSSANPPTPKTTARTAPARRSTPASKKKATPKRKPPPRKAAQPTTTPTGTPSTPSAPNHSTMNTTASVASTSRRSLDRTSKTGSQSTVNSPSTSQKRPGPKSRTVPHDADPPVLVREGAGLSDDVTNLPNGRETSEVATSSVKSPPTLVAYNAEHTLKITSFSLSRGNSPATYVPSGPGAASSSQDSKRKNDWSEAFASSSDVVSSSTAGQVKRPSSQSGPGTKHAEDAEKKRKITSSTPEKKDEQPSMEDLLQLKFQKFRDQQRKRELERKAAAAKADNDNDDVVEIPVDYPASSATRHEREETGQHSSGSRKENAPGEQMETETEQTADTPPDTEKQRQSPTT